MEAPETRYVAVGDADVAYQVVGNGPLDLLWCYGVGGHIDLFWEMPYGTEYLTRLASFSRLILFDRRGTGASGAATLNTPPWEDFTEDMRAVLDAAGSESTALMATLETGPIARLFAAMHPERVSALVLLNTSARYLEADGYPIGASSAAVEALVASTWGTEEMQSFGNPTWAEDPEFSRMSARLNRASATPRAVAAQYDYFLRNVDVRHALPLIQSPTLVLHGQNPVMPISHGRYLADHIENATFIELPAADLGPQDAGVVAEVAEFLTGERTGRDVERILTTVLFTDIVGSTERAASLGDDRWRSLLDSHDGSLREQLRRFRGREINTTGDGFLASFDGPARSIR